MSGNLLLATGAFAILGLVAGWSGRGVRETLGQVDAQVASANQQRLELWKTNTGFPGVEGRPRIEDSAMAVAERIAPWMVTPPPSLAGAAIGQASLRDVIWHATTTGAEPALEVFENGQTLAAGHFDLALVMVFALPLLILFAPRHDAVLLALGPTVSLIGILVSGAPLASSDTWLRTAFWLLLTAVYGYLWLALRRHLSHYWMAGVAYIVLVAVLPGVTLLIAGLVAPPPSRVVLAQRMQSALSPVMTRNSRALAPFYESHPEFVEGGRSPSDYDQLRLQADTEQRAVVAPLIAEADESARSHRSIVKVLAVLSPASIFHLALLETSGTGTSRQEAFETNASEFGQRWSAAVKAKLGRPLLPADLDQLPRFQYAEQPLAGWLMPSALGLAALLAWAGALTLTKPS
jgi:hypothetical protein